MCIMTSIPRTSNIGGAVNEMSIAVTVVPFAIIESASLMC
jgi:hypothetical protein